MEYKLNEVPNDKQSRPKTSRGVKKFGPYGCTLDTIPRQKIVIDESNDTDLRGAEAS